MPGLWVRVPTRAADGAAGRKLREMSELVYFDFGATPVGYREGWEMFLRHVVADTPCASTLLEGAKGLQLVDACYRSARERRWVDLPELSL